MTALSDALEARVRELQSRYPNPRSALILALHEAQDEVGYITDQVIREIAKLFDLNAADVAGVVTFYTMFKRTSPGRFLISLCTNPGCGFFGADEAADTLREVVGPEHETTPDGLMSWEQVECLAYCSAAPACQVNYHDVPNITADRAQRLVAALKEGRELDAVLGELRADARLPEVAGA